MKIQEDSCIVIKDETIGCLYAPNHGTFRMLSADDAVCFEDYLNKYFDEKLSRDDECILENYLNNDILSTPVMPVITSPGLLNMIVLKNLKYQQLQIAILDVCIVMLMEELTIQNVVG